MRVFQVVVKRQQALGNVSVRLRQGLWAGRLDSQQKIDLRRLIKKKQPQTESTFGCEQTDGGSRERCQLPSTTYSSILFRRKRHSCGCHWSAHSESITIALQQSSAQPSTSVERHRPSLFVRRHIATCRRHRLLHLSTSWL